MAKTQPLITSFNAGEFTNEGMARVDQDRVRLAAEIQENILPDVTGAGQVRPGTEFLGNTASDNQPRLLPFVKSIDDTALLEQTNALLRAWVDDALVTRPSVTSTVENGDFSTASATVTITIASPGVVTWTGHGMSTDDTVSFETTGGLPTGLTPGTIYYVIFVSSNSFQVSATESGSAINTSGSQSGVHTGYRGWKFTRTGGATATITGGTLQLQAVNSGGFIIAVQEVTTSDANTQHALKIVVDRGPITFRCGSTEGGDNLISETILEKGEHRLAFTPTGNYWPWFTTELDRIIQVSNITIESSGVMTIAAPWTTAQLPAIRVDQSGDILFLANENWQQRRIERRGDNSWSLAYYEANDGPFTLTETSSAKLSINASRGNTTMSADRVFFADAHLGALFRLFHDGYDLTTTISTVDSKTDSIRVQGVGTDRNWTYEITGTWTGTIAVERSYDGPDFGFVEVSNTTINVSPATVADGLDNSEVWYRLRFKAFTSGIATIRMIFGGGGGWGVVRVTAVNASTNVDVEVLTHTTNTGTAAEWLEGAWSDKRGWPSSVAFFDGRLWWGGNDAFWSSESDAFTTFNPDGEGDAASIQRTVATGGSVNNINWMLPLQRLVFGTDGAEASARASTIDQPLTPTNIGVKNASSQGVAPVSPVALDGRGIFVQRSKRRIYEIAFSGEANDYRSDNLTKFNEDIGGDGINELAVQRQPEPYVWHVRADGQAPILIYDPTEQVQGWIRYIAGPSVAAVATIESITVLPEDEQDAVYLAVKRTIDGSTVRFIEKLAKHLEAEGGSTNKMADAGTLTAGPVSSVTLAHLASETGLVGWGTNASSELIALTGLSANGSGVISLGATYTNVWVGLKYSWRYKTAKLAYGAQFGTALMQPKKVPDIALLMQNVHKDAVNYGRDFTTTFPLPPVEDFETVADNTVHALYDEYSFPLPGNWDTDARVHLKGDAPYPVTFLGIAMVIETNERL